MLINCEIGATDKGYAQDEQVISMIDIACICCMDDGCSQAHLQRYMKMAAAHGVKVAAYLGVNEDINGRDMKALFTCLDEQWENFIGFECVKFKGDLYHYANRSAELAEELALWLKNRGVQEVIAPYRSMLHKACNNENIAVYYEAYADIAYTKMQMGLELMSRDHLSDEIRAIDDVRRQVRAIKRGSIEIEGVNYLIEADTISVNMATEDALEKIEMIAGILK